MFTKTTTALVAAIVLASASAVLADDAPFTFEQNAYMRNPNAPVPTYLGNGIQAPRAQTWSHGTLIEGRNLGVSRGVERDLDLAERRGRDSE